MLKNVTKLIKPSLKLQTNRNVCKGSTHFGRANTYEGEGKTTVQILNNEADLGLMINGFSQAGFRLNNNVTVLGPMVIFPRSVLSWNVKDSSDINEDSLSLFTVLVPKLDILVIGVGDKPDDLSVFKQILSLRKLLRTSLEILPTEQACATFNFLNSESRCVAAALIPPKTIVATDDEVLQTKLRYQNLYVTDDPSLI